MRTKRVSPGLRVVMAVVAILAVTFVMSPHAAAQQETVLYSFPLNANGEAPSPLGSLIFDEAGINLYGTTENGGTYGYGSVFELSPPTTPGGPWTETDLYDFSGGTDGASPYSSLIFDTAGNLYGTTAGGGSGGGTVFELMPTAAPPWPETVLYSLPLNANGEASSPQSSLIFDSAGNLYGTTYAGGLGYGTVFQVSPAGIGACSPANPYFCTLYTFNPGPNANADGSNPSGGLILDAQSHLYGATFNGGNGSTACACGTVFELPSLATPLPWQDNILLSFNFKDGGNPMGNLILDGKGRLYGTTTEGGSPGVGTVFRLTPPTATVNWTETILHNFTDLGTDGFMPQAGLIFDTKGNLYGTTSFGGGYESGYGTVFEIIPSSKTETVLYRFSGPPDDDGAYPNDSLIFDTSGNLYGTTTTGGTNYGGTVFEITGAPTSTLVTSSLNPSIYGQSLTFTATVSSSSGTPTGKVTFKNGSATLGTVTLTGGVASFTTTTLGAGTKSITAVYHGNGLLFASSTSSPALSQVVNKATTTTALASSQNPSSVGQSVTFTASVSPQFSGTPTGSVTFKDGTKTLKTVPLSGGAAGFTTSTLTSGAHTITATYNGSTNFTGSSASLTQTVN